MQKIPAQHLYTVPTPSYSEDQILTELQNLLKSGELDIDTSDGFGLTALHYAANYNHAKAAEWLIKNGADAEAKNNMGFTPLHYASAFGSTAAAETLIKNGADMEARSNMEETPLCLASFYGEVEVTKLLLDKGADINSKNDFGSSLVDWAYKNNHSATIKVLEKHMDKIYHLDNPDQYADFVQLSLVDHATTNENDY